MGGDSSRLARGLLAGIAQTLLSSKPVTGGVLLAAGALVSPLHTLTALVGAAAATGFAAWSRWNRPLFESGLFGFNGAVVGLVWPELFEPGTPGFWLLVPAAIGATALQGRLLPPLSRRDLPVLGLPFILVTWAASLAGAAAGWRRAVAGSPPHLSGPLAGWSDPALMSQIGDAVAQNLPALAVAATAALVTSWALLGVALLGAVAGLGVTVGLGGAQGILWTGAVLYNAVPTAIGVAGVFFPFSARTLAGAAGGAGLAAAVWALVTPPLMGVELFPLTLPMHVVLLTALLLSRRPTGARSGGTTVEPSPAALVALGGLLRRASRVVVLSGAGMSTESGIPDYRSQLGFWFDANAEDLAYQRFLAAPASRRLYWRLQRRFMGVLDRSAPNAGHRTLARLDASGRLLGIITQNVDGLHQAAGCRPERVVELHGSARWVVCVACGFRAPYAGIARRINGVAPPCDRCAGLLKTETVSFGEELAPARLAQAIRWAGEADLLLIVGTSLQVEPAASLPAIARSRGTPVAVVNRTPTPWDAEATLVVRANVAAALCGGLAETEGRRIRRIARADYGFLCQVVDLWWGDAVRYLLHPVYVDHFSDTSLVLEDEHGLVGFLLGAVSQSHPEEAYAHMIATAPDRRGQGLGRALYEAFFRLAGERGCRRIVAITVPYNTGSLVFHRRLGFTFRENGAVWQGNVPVMVDHAGPGVHCVVMERRI